MALKKPTFAARLRTLREAAAISQSELARRSSLTAGLISQLESGMYRPGWDTVCAIAKALGVSTEEFRDA